MLDWLKRAPTPVVVSVIIVCGVGFLALLGAFVYLEVNGEDTTDFRAFVNTLANLVLLPVAGAGTLAAAAGYQSARMAERQTNGHLAERDEEIAKLRQQLDYARRHGS